MNGKMIDVTPLRKRLWLSEFLATLGGSLDLINDRRDWTSCVEFRDKSVVNCYMPSGKQT